MEPSAGLLIADRVRLERPLAAGAMGAVWVGHHLALDVDVAVKFIKSEAFREDLRARQRFEREARAAARIKSPHVVQTFDCGITDDGTPYLVMELLEGETLRRRIERAGALPPDEVAAIVSQVCKALGRAHALGIVHRDVKPENLFLVRADDEPFVKLLDFGIAKQSEMPADGAATQSGVLVGTPQYMSPEQLLRPKQADFRGDLWALAVVAYHALGGKPPFTGETVAGLIVAITQGRFPRVSTVRPELPTALDAWFDRALGLEPEERFATAAALGDSFAAALGLPASSKGREAGASEPGDDVEGSTAGNAANDTAAFVAEHALALRSEPAEHGDAQPTSEGSLLATTQRSAASTASAARGPAGAASLAHAPTRQRWVGLAVGLGAAVVVGWVALRGLSPSIRQKAHGEGPSPETSAGGTPSSAAAPSGSTSGGASRAELTDRPAGTASNGPDDAGPSLIPIAATEIEAGAATEVNAWLPRFKIVRHDGDEGADYLGAMMACRAHAMALCTEPQWLRACTALPELGPMESWTASPAAERGFVVRGGARGCASRQVVPIDERGPRRIGACCERAVALVDDNASRNFLRSTSAKLLAYERAADAGDLVALGNLLDAEIAVQKGQIDRNTFIGRTRGRLAKVREHWLLHDLCEVRLTEMAGEPAWSADCRTLVREDERLVYLMRRYRFGGPEGKLQSYLEPKVLRELSLR